MAHSSLEMNTNSDNSNQACEHYCLIHDIFCSFDCVMENHRFCQVMSQDNVTENARSNGKSTRKEDKKVETGIRDLTQEFLAIEKFLSDMSSSIDDQQKQCLMKITEVRNQINIHLDSLEKKVRDVISTEHKKLKSKLEDTMKRICHNKISLQDMTNRLDKIKRDGTERQLLLAVKSSEQIFKHMSQYIDELRQTDELMEKNISVNVDPTLNEFDTRIDSFGMVMSKSTKSIMSYSKPVMSGFAQYQPRSEVRVNLKNVEKFKCPKEIDITGCALLPEKKYVFVDSLKKQIHILESGMYKGTVTFDNSPFDVCHVEDNTVAVTIPNDNAVFYVDIVLREIIKSLRFENKCYYVDSDGKRLAFGFSDKNLIIITDLEGKEINRFKIRGKRFTLHKFGIYSVNERDDEVLRYDLSGKELWTYPDKIMRPVGVAVDFMGYAYVFSKFNDAIYAISPYGFDSRIVKDKDDADFSDFRCLCIKPHSNQLLICSCNQVSIYKADYQYIS